MNGFKYLLQGGVYEGAVHLDELNMLLSRRYIYIYPSKFCCEFNLSVAECSANYISCRRSCPDYWEKRLESERVERVRQAKEHWASMSRAFMGI